MAFGDEAHRSVPRHNAIPKPRHHESSLSDLQTHHDARHPPPGLVLQTWRCTSDCPLPLHNERGAEVLAGAERQAGCERHDEVSEINVAETEQQSNAFGLAFHQVHRAFQARSLSGSEILVRISDAQLVCVCGPCKVESANRTDMLTMIKSVSSHSVIASACNADSAGERRQSLS